MTRHDEFEILDKDGNSFVLSGPKRHPTQISGLAMPPVKHWTTRAPFQHGRTHWGYAVQPRLVTIGLLLRACDRDGHWDARMGNVAMFNPANGPLKLRLRRQDRNVYELHDGWYQAGYELQATDLDDPFSVEGVSQIEFEDPFWKWTTAPLAAGQSRDSEGRVCVLQVTWTVTPELRFPFSGPFVLGTEVTEQDVTAYNSGTWEASPVISVTGPMGDWVLDNETTGDQITWNGYAVADGETVVVNVPLKLTYNGDGDDLTAYSGGNTGTFALAPGTNTLSFWAADLEDGLYPNLPSLQVCWYVEVLGL